MLCATPYHIVEVPVARFSHTYQKPYRW